MKRIIFLLILISLTSINTYSQWRHPWFPISRSFSDIAVRNQTIFLGSKYTGIYTSGDSGNNWVNINNRFKAVLISGFTFVGDSFFVCTTDRGIFLSTDDGNSWQQRDTGLADSSVNDLTTNGKVYIAATNSGIFKSTDGCSSWQWTFKGLPSYNMAIYSVKTLDRLIVVGTDSGIYYSSDDGNTWVHSVINDYSGNVYQIVVCDSVMFATQDSTGLLKSQDSGRTWHTLSFLSDNHFTSLAKVNNEIYSPTYFVRNDTNVYNNIFKSKDLGLTWDTVSGLSPTSLIRLIENANTIYAMTDGEAFNSTDNGASWNSITPIMPIYEVNADGIEYYFVSTAEVKKNTIFLGTYSYDSKQHKISTGLISSTDEGRRWKPVVNGFSNKTITDLRFADPNSFALSEYDGLYISTDQGGSWTYSNRSIKTGYWGTNPLSIQIADSTVLLGSDNNLGVFLSNDAGNTWKESISGMTNKYVNAVLMDGNIYYSGTKKGLFVTSDQGSIWKNISQGLGDSTIISIVTVNGKLFVATSQHGVYVSPVSGISWSPVNLGMDVTDANSIAVSGNKVFVGSASYGVLYSGNGGSSWKQATDGMSSTSVYKIKIAGDKIFAYLGSEFMNYAYLSDFIQTDVPDNPDNSHITSNQNLLAVSPNPFSDQTNIGYTLNIDCNTTLSIRNLLGEEILCLVDNQFKNEGSHTVSINSSALQPGLYFLVLKAGNTFVTKKLMLVK